jgi:hypothetical protein
LTYLTISHFDQNQFKKSDLSSMTTPPEQQAGKSDFCIDWTPTMKTTETKTTETLCWLFNRAKFEVHAHCHGVLHK